MRGEKTESSFSRGFLLGKFPGNPLGKISQLAEKLRGEKAKINNKLAFLAKLKHFLQRYVDRRATEIYK